MAKSKASASAKTKPDDAKPGRAKGHGSDGHWVTIETADGRMRPIFLAGPRHGQTAAQRKANAATLRGASGGLEREHATAKPKGGPKTLHGAQSMVGKAAAAHNRGKAAKVAQPKPAAAPGRGTPERQAKAMELVYARKQAHSQIAEHGGVKGAHRAAWNESTPHAGLDAGPHGHSLVRIRDARHTYLARRNTGAMRRDVAAKPKASAPKASSAKAVGRGTPERLDRAMRLRAANPVRQQARQDAAEIAKAYQQVSGGKANVRVRLADLREKLPHLPRERQDAALMQLATRKHQGASLDSWDGQHGANARDRAAALMLPSGHRRDFIYLGGPSSGVGRDGFPVAPRPSKVAELRAARKPTAPAPAKPAGERIKAARQALAKPVPEATRAKVLGAIRSLDDQAATGAPVSVRELRAKLASDLPRKTQFDRTVRKLTEEGHLDAHRYDNAYAHGTTAAQRAAMVRRPAAGTPKRPGESRRGRESHYNAVSLGPEARKPAAVAPGFALKQERNSRPKPFESTGKGKTPAMFEEMRGANARDLPGQRTMFGQRPAASPERADALTKPVGRSTFRAAVESAKRNAGAKRDKLAATIKSQRKELAEARTSSVRDVRPDSVEFDPQRFQYKLNAEHGTGSVGSLQGVKKWDPELGGVLQVWKDPANGKTYVVNGHNRLDLARRLGADKVSVRHIVAKDAAEARAKGAITNIAEGRGNSTDAAQFFRDTGMTRAGLESRGVPLREKVATEGLAISGLEEGLWRQHKAGELSANRAAIIGGSGLTHAQQAAVAKSSGKAGVAGLNDRDLKEYIDNAREAPTVKNRTLDLFGSNEEDISLGAFRAKAQGFVKDKLGKEKRVFGTVAKSGNAADLERAGNKINAGESGKIAQTAAENLHVFDQLKNRRGPVADLLNEAADRVHKGESTRKVHDEIYRRLPKAIQEMLRGG